MPTTTKRWNILSERWVPEDLALLDTVPDMKSLPDPFGLPDMEHSIRFLLEAMETNRPIIIYGDYDLDGISGSAILHIILTELRADCRIKIPDRLKDGYGFNPFALSSVGLFTQPPLVITVDNGSSAHEGIRKAKQDGIDVIVTDHHPLKMASVPCDVCWGLPEGETCGGCTDGYRIEAVLPDCVGVVHPKREGTPVAFQHLSGAGVAWMFAYAICKALDYRWPGLRAMLDLAALGTVADVVPLRGVNRLIVKTGLELIAKRSRLGISALCDAFIAAGESPGKRDQRKKDVAAPTAELIGFYLGPRLNAAGRLLHGKAAADLLTTTYREEAYELAAMLEDLNDRRRELTDEAVATCGDGFVHVSDSWPPGIAGVIAGHLCEERQTPQVVIAVHEGIGHGSCRSPEGFDLTPVIDSCRDLLISGGGHAAAAGIKLEAQHIPAFVEKFTALIQGAQLPEPSIKIHGRMGLGELTFDVLEKLDALAPFGAGNEAPVFRTGLVMVESMQVLKDVHLKLVLTDGNLSREALWFYGVGQAIPNEPEFAYVPMRSEFKGRTSIKLKIVAVRDVGGSFGK